MQAQIHTITYAGIELEDINQFIENGTPISMATLEPTFVGYQKSTQWTTSNITHSSNLFVVQDNTIYYIGFTHVPWTIRSNYLDILTDLNFKHWGYTFDQYLSGNNAKIWDPKVRDIGSRKFVLCQDNNSIATLLSFNDSTFLLTDALTYHLWDGTVVWFQWIEMPDGTSKVLLKIDDEIRFVTIPDAAEGYPVIGQPINATELTRIKISPGILGRNFTCRFYYHNDILCVFVSNVRSNSVSVGDTEFWHYDEELDKFLLDLTVPASSPFTYYSSYNKAVNIPYQNPNFIGDFQWMVVTPLSDLYMSFHNNDISHVIKYFSTNYLRPSNTAVNYWGFNESGDKIYYMFTESQTRVFIRMTEFTFTQPLASSLILNIHNGKPLTAVTGYYSVEGDLFVDDFEWELTNKTEYKILEGQPEINVVEPTLINLRFTPQIPQIIDRINFVPSPICVTPPPAVPPPAHPHPDFRTDGCFHFTINPQSESIVDFIVPFKEFMHFSRAMISIDTVLPEVAPFIRLTVAMETVRHCTNNAQVICIASRPEFQTLDCNENCPAYLRRIIELLINQSSGVNIVGTVEDEREIFPPHNQLGYIKLELEY